MNKDNIIIDLNNKINKINEIEYFKKIKTYKQNNLDLKIMNSLKNYIKNIIKLKKIENTFTISENIKPSKFIVDMVLSINKILTLYKHHKFIPNHIADYKNKIDKKITSLKNIISEHKQDYFLNDIQKYIFLINKLNWDMMLIIATYF
jgi:hypothetical protein